MNKYKRMEREKGGREREREKGETVNESIN